MKSIKTLVAILGVIALLVAFSPLAQAWHANSDGGKSPDPGDTCPDPDRPNDVYVWTFTADPNANNGNGPNGQSGYWGWEQPAPPPPTGGGCWGTNCGGQQSEDFGQQQSNGQGSDSKDSKKAKIVAVADLKLDSLAATVLKLSQSKEPKIGKVVAVADPNLASLAASLIKATEPKITKVGKVATVADVNLSSLAATAIKVAETKNGGNTSRTDRGFIFGKTGDSVKKLTQSTFQLKAGLPEPIPRPADIEKVSTQSGAKTMLGKMNLKDQIKAEVTKSAGHSAQTNRGWIFRPAHTSTISLVAALPHPLPRPAETVKRSVSSPAQVRAALPEPIPRPAGKIVPGAQTTAHLAAILPNPLPRPAVQATRLAHGAHVQAHAAARR